MIGLIGLGRQLIGVKAGTKSIQDIRSILSNVLQGYRR